jgi:hypothetical protein
MLEFRLYYDEQGNVLFYTCEEAEGNYIVIDAQTYAECRVDIKVVNGEIVKNNQIATISKLIPSTNGVKCASIDINIIVDDYDDAIVWNTKNYEHKFN